MSVPTDPALTEYRLCASRIRASFIPYGARLTSLQVPDRDGEWREVVVGHADVAAYKREKSPTYFGCVVGRYANRIAGGKFTIDGKEHQVTCNEHDGRNSLHGGARGYDARDWTVVKASETSITFSLLDEGFEGFPGNVLVHATYTVSEGKLTTVLVAQALDAPTPLLLTTHTFFRLGSTVADTVLDDTLHLPSATRYVAGDDILLPTGEIVTMSADHPLNYTSPDQISRSQAAKDLAGRGSAGIDNCFIFADPQAPESRTAGGTKLICSSPATGIRMAVHTNQPALQIYNGIAFDGSIQSQVGPLHAYGAMAVEPQGWIDGINHPEWGQDQVYSSATGPQVSVSEYVFDTVQ